MRVHREPGNAEIFDLFKKNDGSPTALAKRLEKNGKDLSKYKRWQVRWTGYDSKQKAESFKKQADAKRFKNEITAQFQRGEYIDRTLSQATVESIYERWEPTTSGLSAKTRYDRKGSWERNVKPRWGSVEVGSIRKTDIQQWVAEMYDDGNGLGSSSISRALEVLRLTLQFALDDGRIRVNPAAGVGSPRPVKAECEYLTVEQAETLANAITERYKTLIRVFTYCGLRWGEATALRAKDIDLERKRLKVVKAFSYPGGKRVEKDAKTHEKRTVPYPALMEEDLKKLIEGKSPNDRVFLTETGSIINPSNFRNREYVPAKKAAAEILEAPFPNVRVHDLRHTAASLAVKSGANVKAVQRMLGHKSAKMTLDTYADLFDDDLDEVAEKMHLLILDSK